MKLINFRNANATKMRKSFRPRPHDPMLVLNMSIFNSERGWERIFNTIPGAIISGHERRTTHSRVAALMPPGHDEARKRVFSHFLALHEA
jgi:hypothetical protein